MSDVRNKLDILNLFNQAKQNDQYLKICAPMVRYSKLHFRQLIRSYNTDICFTPMIMADSFALSEKARCNEFSTNADDSPLIAQFAANSSNDFLKAAQLIYPFVDGVDLNCGCPQRWAMDAGYGSAMLARPELIKDIISTIKRNLPKDLSVSVKMRLIESKSVTSTVDLCRQLEQCGVDFLTLHSRTAKQKSSLPPNIKALIEVKKSLQIPLVANGSVYTLYEADKLQKLTNCDGIMAARGMLSNPTLFTGNMSTPFHCLEKWVNIAAAAGDRIVFKYFHHHVAFMSEKLMNKQQRLEFSNFSSKAEVFSYLSDNFSIIPNKEYELKPEINCKYDENMEENQLFGNPRDGKYYLEFNDRLNKSEEELDLSEIYFEF